MRYDRLELLRKEKGISATHLCSQIGKERYYISNCKSKGIAIPDNYLQVWADLLDTTPEYLRGETDRKEKTPAEPASVRSDIAEFMEKVSQLPTDAVSRLNDLADLILSARDGKK